MTTPENPPALFCPTCTYDLRYTTDPRCPECGSPFDRADLAISRIPWVHRKQIGLLKAWRRTTALVLRPSQRLAHEIALPIDPVAASRFRWLNVFLTTALLVAGIITLYSFSTADDFHVRINFTYDIPQLTFARIFAPAFALVDRPAGLFALPIAALATVAALSQWPPFLLWIISRSTPLRPRAAALTLYLSAWLPLFVLVAFTNIAIALTIRDSSGDPSTAAIISIVVLDFTTLFTWWITNILLYARTTNTGLLRAILFALLHPIGALLLFYAVSIATLFLLGLLALILVSLTT